MVEFRKQDAVSFSVLSGLRSWGWPSSLIATGMEIIFFPLWYMAPAFASTIHGITRFNTMHSVNIRPLIVGEGVIGNAIGVSLRYKCPTFRLLAFGYRLVRANCIGCTTPPNKYHVL